MRLPLVLPHTILVAHVQQVALAGARGAKVADGRHRTDELLLATSAPIDVVVAHLSMLIEPGQLTRLRRRLLIIRPADAQISGHPATREVAITTKAHAPCSVLAESRLAPLKSTSYSRSSQPLLLHVCPLSLFALFAPTLTVAMRSQLSASFIDETRGGQEGRSEPGLKHHSMQDMQ